MPFGSPAVRLAGAGQEMSRMLTSHRLLAARPTATRVALLARHPHRCLVPSRSRIRPFAASGQDAPSLVDDSPRTAAAEVPKKSPKPPSPSPPPGPEDFNPKIVWRKAVRSLSSLQLAIAEMAVIAGLSAIGTIIPQNEAVSFYIQNYPDGPEKVLGFLTYDTILRCGFDHIYTADYFIGINLLLGASLAACSYTRQLPMVKVARNWKFAGSAAAVGRNGNYNKTLPAARLRDLGKSLADTGYQVFNKGDELYAFKGIAGRYAPIGVHVSMLAVMFGVIFGAVGGYKGSAMIPAGQEFLVGSAIKPYTPLGFSPSGAKAVVKADDFRITYRENGQVEQYYTDLTARNVEDGRVLKTKTINVNEPLRIGGVTMYQTDWGIAAINLKVAGDGSSAVSADSFLLPMADLENSTVGLAGKAWGSFLPTQDAVPGGGPPKGISMIARDLQTVTFYDSKGEFAGVRRTDSKKPLQVDGVELIVDGMVGSTGLELKVDPGVPYVYAGFGGMMITTLLSYISHSQVWACQDEDDVHVGGKTNRATITFEAELEDVLASVPEVKSTPVA